MCATLHDQIIALEDLAEPAPCRSQEELRHEQDDLDAIARTCVKPALQERARVAADAAAIVQQVLGVYADAQAKGLGMTQGRDKGCKLRGLNRGPMSIVLQVLGALVLVVVASDAFTNAVEWMGAIFGLTRSAVGAVVAAIGSSLPETMVALIALLVLHDAQSHAIGIGAVLGAPLMLSTVVFCLIGVTALSRGVKGVPGRLRVPLPDTLFGTGLFCATFALALAASFVSVSLAHAAAAVLVLVAYALYLVYHLRSDKPEAEESPPRLRIAPKVIQPPLALVVTQLIAALILTIVASRWFVASVGLASESLHISPFLVSLFLTPIATELPEVSNVMLWMRRGQDELAVGNVLGAMMFQTSVTCAIAMMATPWQLDENAHVAGAIALLSTLSVLIWTALRRRLEPLALAAGGIFYVGYVAYVIARR